MAKQIPEHKDILGRILNVGDYVAYPDSNQLRIGKEEVTVSCASG